MEASPELKHRPSRVSDSDEKADDYVDADVVDEEKANSDSISDDTESVKVIEKAEEVAIEVRAHQFAPFIHPSLIQSHDLARCRSSALKTTLTFPS